MVYATSRHSWTGAPTFPTIEEDLAEGGAARGTPRLVQTPHISMYMVSVREDSSLYH